METVPRNGGMGAKADREVSTATAPAAVQGAVPATPAGELDEWETKVLDELESLKALWDEYARHLWDEAKKLRAENREEAIDKAVGIETFIDYIDMLFAEARSELENGVDARVRGDDVNMVISAQRVGECLDMLRIYAKEWKAYVDKLLGREGENNG
jgi:hypothetical protein